ncbi:MAG: AAA family ATPase [Bacteroidales bacterium]|nr:AAA family ATPase [Bacteroidales bacterium]
MKGLKQQIEAYCEARRISQNVFATKAGVNAAFVSNILNGKPVSREVQTKIAAFLGGKEVCGLIETGDFRMIQAMCAQTARCHFMVGLIGDTGTGKTTALKAYARRENVFMVSASKTLTAKQLVFDIAAEMGLARTGTVADAMRKICKRLNSIANPLLIVDEAGKLNARQLMYLQELRDATEHNAALLLSGMPYFREKLNEGAQKHREGYAEFYRRVQLWGGTNGLSRDEIRLVIEAEGMEPVPELFTYRLFGTLKNNILMMKINQENQSNDEN